MPKTREYKVRFGYTKPEFNAGAKERTVQATDALTAIEMCASVVNVKPIVAYVKTPGNDGKELLLFRRDKQTWVDWDGIK